MFEYEIKLLKEWIEKDNSFFDIASYELRNKETTAEIILKNFNIVLSGIEIIEKLLKEYEIKAEFYFKDGDFVENGIIGKLRGNAYNILIVERTMLNILSLMSAVATKTYTLISKIDGKTRLAATRKIFPGLGNLEKMAVLHGGGDSHRWNLSESIMIKDNHIKLYGGVENAINVVKKYKSFTKKIEIEVENETNAFLAAKNNVDIIMLDNFDSKNAKKLAKKLKREYPKIIIEVSGGINENNYLEYVDDNIDIISMGKLTTEVKYIDFSLEIEN
ncbi:nicotinate-nucleotide pyrophosphorylase [carboxylating] [Marinitoga hydrogenitolerans DSM 16785]|uniref:nicotinate-nucleotide diphosphorylase (carboxylating) n=1 Tax=Marinitoga hydrogenitolerans (strain DSM 16785 / JCM 12826 / AT1271) TaxID=1122195 RepID=A0A1M4YJE3_MARH1|nr:carboxylating nicotinate-nucleotide diphosphorylase [Marinitoga hydrogenitolerans]SHF05773.1 nicotinate-nucleotide pyrophosphorylase [carboxylating] [Marinitoga hydrogenitolerans DSM 16785]